jgi:hypothetical protein
MSMLRIAIIIGSTRPGRKAAAVADWINEIASSRDDAIFELVDLADYELPVLDELLPAAYGRYEHPHTKAWAETIASFDALTQASARTPPPGLLTISRFASTSRSTDVGLLRGIQANDAPRAQKRTG